MAGNDKIFVVIIVLLLILAGIFLYLGWMDRRLRKCEKELEDKKQRHET
ncbi:MAG TPA: hypothetical protein P5531_09880 [Bacteroidales bacterium]|nr:hypothetical protein [Bacteroidales bacterium]HSA43946.1 hypothetical protein [Bacteroidales bacterium]